MSNSTFNHQICEHTTELQIFAIKFTKDIEDANDLVQDTLIKAIRYEKLYQQGSNLKAWLYTIMRNTFINNYRRISKTRQHVETTEDLSSYQLKSSACSNYAENTFMMDDINKAMTKLQPEYSVPFLKYFEGFKYHEIAVELNIPIGTVKTRIHVARQLLKNNLKMYTTEYKKTNMYRSA